MLLLLISIYKILPILKNYRLLIQMTKLLNVRDVTIIIIANA